MKKNILLLLLLALFSFPLIAQDEKDDEEVIPKHRKTKVGGAGGFTPGMSFFDNTEIDKVLKSSHLPTLGNDPMYMLGGEGYGYIMFLKNVRMGGAGVSGSKTVNILDTAGGLNIRKEVVYKISYGGFLMDYVVPVVDRLDLAVGFTIGGGSLNVTMRRDSSSFKDYNVLWNEFGSNGTKAASYTRNLTGSFGVFTPHVQVEYAILQWLQLRIGASYPIMFSPDWKLDDNYTIENVPSGLKANGYTINAGIMFGFFN